MLIEPVELSIIKSNGILVLLDFVYVFVSIYFRRPCSPKKTFVQPEIKTDISLNLSTSRQSIPKVFQDRRKPSDEHSSIQKSFTDLSKIKCILPVPDFSARQIEKVRKPSELPIVSSCEDLYIV